MSIVFQNVYVHKSLSYQTQYYHEPNLHLPPHVAVVPKLLPLLALLLTNHELILRMVVYQSQHQSHGNVDIRVMEMRISELWKWRHQSYGSGDIRAMEVLILELQYCSVYAAKCESK